MRQRYRARNRAAKKPNTIMVPKLLMLRFRNGMVKSSGRMRQIQLCGRKGNRGNGE